MSSKSRRIGAFLALCWAAGPAFAATLTPIDPAAPYPEGPVAVGDIVYYTEMGADRVMRWDGASVSEIWSRKGCLPTSVARGPDDTLVVLCHSEGALVRITTAGQTLAVIDRDEFGRKFVNPNASINDGHGGIYLSASGPFSPAVPPQGAVLRLGADGRLSRVAEGIRYSNGVALSADGGTLFVSEHLNRRILAYRVNPDGSLSDRRIYLALDDVVGADPARSWEVGPDGLATDADGNLYIAEYGGGRVIIVDKDRTLVATIETPERYTTAPILIDGGRRLFITAPASLFDPAEPGKVYVTDNPAYAGD